jgi:hypothetical protein
MLANLHFRAVPLTQAMMGQLVQRCAKLRRRPALIRQVSGFSVFFLICTFPSPISW